MLERNWRPGAGLRGELDLVALDPTTGASAPALVCVEVKTRASRPAAPPAAAVTAAKLARLRALTGAWAASHEVAHCGLRIDVVSIVLRPGLPAVLRHHRGVGL